MSARLKTLTTLLDRQGDVLRNGDLAGLAGLQPLLERAMSGVERAPAEAAEMDELASLRALATRNASMVAAALRGVQSARSALSRKPTASFTGYDARGQAAMIGGDRPSVVWRS